MYGEGAVTDWTCQKGVVKFYAGDFWLDDAPWSGRQIEIDSGQIQALIEDNQWMLYHMGDSQYVKNIQINKVIGENEECVFCSRDKNHTDLLANPISCWICIP